MVPASANDRLRILPQLTLIFVLSFVAPPKQWDERTKDEGKLAPIANWRGTISENVFETGKQSIKHFFMSSSK
jgi:hypothetical protein